MLSSVYLGLLLLSACGDSDEKERVEGSEPGDCTDGADNDLDGAFDCDDDGCENAPDCQGEEAIAEPSGEPSTEPSAEPSGEPSGEPTSEPSGEPSSEDIDNDGDGVPESEDCDDNNTTLGSNIKDTDCDGAVDPFYIAANGRTVICGQANVGDTGILNGITYTKRNREQLEQLIEDEEWNNSQQIENTCTSDITDMYRMFRYTESFNQDIGSWDTSNVTDMSSMFYYAESFNQDIGSWDTSNVTEMSYMFYSALSFNQDLSGWCVSNISTLPTQFDLNANNWTEPQPIWGTCP